MPTLADYTLIVETSNLGDDSGDKLRYALACGARLRHIGYETGYIMVDLMPCPVPEFADILFMIPEAAIRRPTPQETLAMQHAPELTAPLMQAIRHDGLVLVDDLRLYA